MKQLTCVVAVVGLLAAHAASKEENGLPPELVERLKDTRILEKSCAFVCSPDGKRVLGTGFFVQQHIPESGTFFVTAKHVVLGNGLFDRSDATLRLRVNTKDGKSSKIISHYLALEGSRPWFQHRNPGVDLAVFPLLMAKRDFKIEEIDAATFEFINHMAGLMPNWDRKSTLTWIHQVPNFALKPFREREKIGPGTETLTMGLVPYVHYHMSRPDAPNIALQKRGFIAAMPEVDMLETGGDPRAGRYYPVQTIYLDCQVVHGNSGSPVFCARKGVQINDEGAYDILGVVCYIPNDGNSLGTGITGVCPIDYLADILCYPEVEHCQRVLAGQVSRQNQFWKDVDRIKSIVNDAHSKLNSTNVAEVLAAQQRIFSITNEVKLIDKRKWEIYGDYFKRYLVQDIRVLSASTNTYYRFP